MGQEILNGKPQACPPATSAPLRTFHFCFWSVFPTVASRSACQFLFSGCCCSDAKSCLFANPLTATHQAPLSSHLPEFAQTRVHRVGDAIQPSHPLPPPSPFAFSLSQHQGLFQQLSSSHLVAKVLSFSISLSNEYSGLISFTIDWFHLLAVQVTLKSLLQYHSSKASVLQHSAFFVVQLSYSYTTTGKTIALTLLDLCQQNDVSAF